MNNWNFTGHLGADAEVKHINDSTVTEFRIAVPVGFGDRESTVWARCSYWGRRGEAVAPYLKKGTHVACHGELNIREYDRDDGSKGYSPEVRLDGLTLLGGRREETREYATVKEIQDEVIDERLPF